MYEQYQVLTSAEAASLWGLSDSTLRRAISDLRLPAQKSGGTWLVSTTDMVAVYGDPKPDISSPTVGETCHIKTDTKSPPCRSSACCGHGSNPLQDVGRVPEKHDRHVLKTADGKYIVIGGDWLQRGQAERVR